MSAAIHNTNLIRYFEVSQGQLCIITAYRPMQLTNDMAAPFLQEANFLWLTGITDPGWKAIIDGSRKRVTLVRPERSQVEEIFDGAYDEVAIKAKSGANEIINAKEYEPMLRKLAKQHSMVYTISPRHTHPFVANPAPLELHAQLARLFARVEDCSKQLSQLRAVKSSDEIAVIRRAVTLTCASFAKIRKSLATYQHEYEIEADMTSDIRRVNAKHAYEPIVASGANAVTLHYTANQSKLSKRAGVLIDVGARVDGYAADITRTYCVNPTKRFRDVHAAVEYAHHEIVALLCPDLLVSQYIATVDEIMKDALQKLGLLSDRDDTETYRKYFPHAISHGLGIDVHDSLGAPRYFKPGMVLTVEPGIYIAEEGIGVRIEDDILITSDGHENLSGSLPTAL